MCFSDILPYLVIKPGSLEVQKNELDKNLIRNALQLELQPKSSTVLVKKKVRAPVFISFAGQTQSLL